MRISTIEYCTLFVHYKQSSTTSAPILLVKPHFLLTPQYHSLFPLLSKAKYFVIIELQDKQTKQFAIAPAYRCPICPEWGNILVSLWI